MAFSGGGGGKLPIGEINVTPLVDVMLVLLIIFMVSAPMMNTGVDVDLPAAQAPQVQIDEEKLLLTVTKDGKVYLGRDEVATDKLEATLLSNERMQREKELYVQADETVPYGIVVKVIAIVKKAGISKLGLVTDPLASE
ncbi:MAG: Biopolymer transport protein ExbD/TolR [Myxococcaceae bacterium]|nr:Biopolymer transport protein ExbD/TolR [Myxococcaceae bacterium]